MCKGLKNEERKMQSNDLQAGRGTEAKHIKFIIADAFDSFCAIQHIRIETTKSR